MQELKPNLCNRCGKPTEPNPIYTCYAQGGHEETVRGCIEYRADGTRHQIKSKQEPGVILRQTKKRGIKKI